MKNGENTIINFCKFLIRLLISLIFIRMILQCKLPISTFDLFIRSTFRNLQNVIVTLPVTQLNAHTPWEIRKNTNIKYTEKSKKITYDANAIKEHDKIHNRKSNFDVTWAIRNRFDSLWWNSRVRKQIYWSEKRTIWKVLRFNEIKYRLCKIWTETGESAGRGFNVKWPIRNDSNVFEPIENRHVVFMSNFLSFACIFFSFQFWLN